MLWHPLCISLAYKWVSFLKIKNPNSNSSSFFIILLIDLWLSFIWLLKVADMFGFFINLKWNFCEYYLFIWNWKNDFLKRDMESLYIDIGFLECITSSFAFLCGFYHWCARLGIVKIVVIMFSRFYFYDKLDTLYVMWTLQG